MAVVQDPSIGTSRALLSGINMLTGIQDKQREDARKRILDARYEKEKQNEEVKYLDQKNREQDWHNEQSLWQKKNWDHTIKIENEAKLQERLLANALKANVDDTTTEDVVIPGSPATMGNEGIIKSRGVQNKLRASERTVIEKDAVDRAELFGKLYDKNLKNVDESQYTALTPKGELAKMNAEENINMGSAINTLRSGFPLAVTSAEMLYRNTANKPFEVNQKNVKEHPEWFNVDKEGFTKEAYNKALKDSKLGELQLKYLSKQDLSIPKYGPGTAAGPSTTVTKEVPLTWDERKNLTFNKMASTKNINGSTLATAMKLWVDNNPKPTSANSKSAIVGMKYLDEVKNEKYNRAAFLKMYPHADPTYSTTKESREAYVTKKTKGNKTVNFGADILSKLEAKDGNEANTFNKWYSAKKDEINKLPYQDKQYLKQYILSRYSNESVYDPSDILPGNSAIDDVLREIRLKNKLSR